MRFGWDLGVGVGGGVIYVSRHAKDEQRLSEWKKSAVNSGRQSAPRNG